MKRLKPQPNGYTLLELTFAIGLLTFITMTSVAAFVGILGLYNKAQSLVRTQQETRNAIDQLTRDLRQTYTVIYRASSVDYQAAMGGAPLRGPISNMKDFFCLTSEDTSFQVGYALLWRQSTGNFHLVRSASCQDFTNVEQTVSLDVWSDKGSGNPVPVDGGVSESSAATPAALPMDRRPLVISQITNTDPKVWYVRVSTYRGGGLPGTTTFDLDRFGAQTTLESVITTRQ